MASRDRLPVSGQPGWMPRDSDHLPEASSAARQEGWPGGIVEIDPPGFEKSTGPPLLKWMPSQETPWGCKSATWPNGTRSGFKKIDISSQTAIDSSNIAANNA